MACDFEVRYPGADNHEAGGGDPTDAVLTALDLIEKLEDQMTIYRDHGEVIAINQRAAAEPVEVEPRLFKLLQLAARLHRETNGAFDITSGPLSRAWGFLQREGRLPDQWRFSNRSVAWGSTRWNSTSCQERFDFTRNK